MAQRSKILLVFGIVYIIFASVIYFGLKLSLKKNFSEQKLETIISGKSIFRDMTDDVCRYQVLGDPKEIGNYVKVEMLCQNGRKANSTLSLSAIADKTIGGFLKEYARIMGFDEKILVEKKFACYLDGEIITEEMKKEPINPKVTLRCIQGASL